MKGKRADIIYIIHLITYYIFIGSQLPKNEATTKGSKAKKESVSEFSNILGTIPGYEFYSWAVMR